VIASVRGRVAALGPDVAVVELGGADGGLGVAVVCTPATLAGLRVGDQARLATSLVVREDSMTLYGFADDDERVLFELLQTASGVGPRLAQAMLAVHRPDELRRAVAGEDLTALTKVPGIGRKGAARIVLELKDRIGLPRGDGSGGGAPGVPADGSDGAAWRSQVHAALIGLGWSTREADEALVAVTADLAQAEGSDQPVDVAELLRAALRTLDRT
jgi:Holliday junction DNA helicase RuvA